MKKNIYLAGGCFWAVQKLFSMVPHVKAVCGYANGNKEIIPTYEKVCNTRTGYKETVKVTYDDEEVSLKLLLFMYFQIIDPTVRDRQGSDRGHQYQTGIYYDDEESEKIIGEILPLEKEYAEFFFVESEPLLNFYDAEDYHQDYLLKNPGGYCHVNPLRMKAIMDFLENTCNGCYSEFEYNKASREILKITV